MYIMSLATQLIFALYVLLDVLLDTLVDALTACACQSNPCPRLDPSDLAVPSILIFRPQAKLISLPGGCLVENHSDGLDFGSFSSIEAPTSAHQCPRGNLPNVFRFDHQFTALNRLMSS
jgi:hypothetical protein